MSGLPYTRKELQAHGRMVYGTCLRILRNQAAAEDVAQECFEILVRGVGEGPPRDLGAWLHGVATRRALMQLRSQRAAAVNGNRRTQPVRRQPWSKNLGIWARWWTRH